MNNNDSQTDIEHVISNFCIRKQTPNNVTESSNLTERVQDSTELYVPLLIADLLRATMKVSTSRMPWGAVESKQQYQVFNGTVSFRTCIVHARIVDKLRCSRFFYKYRIDDGTARMVLSIGKHEELLNTVHSLDAEANRMMRKDREACQRMRRVLASCKQELDYSNLKRGLKVLVHGRPEYCRVKCGLRAFSLYRDNGVARDSEIAFKDELIEWYRHTVPACRNELAADNLEND